MRKALHLLLHLSIWFAPVVCAAQTDSLFRVWNDVNGPDSARIKAIQQLAWKAVFELPDSGIALAKEQLVLAERIKDRMAIYEAHTTMAVGSSMKSDFPTALGHFQTCLATARSMGDRKREANTYSNMSNVYRHMGDLPMALEQLQRSQRIDTELGNKEGLAGTFNNIGNIHTELGDLPAALEHYTRSAGLYDELDQTKGRAQALLNLGVTHLEMGEREKALAEFLQSLALYRTMGRKLEVGMALNNLGRTYARLGRTKDAKHSLDSALVLFTELDSKRQMARSLYYLGDLDLQEGHPRKAIVHCERGLAIARAAGLALQRKECSECLMMAYERVNDLGNAFRAQKEFMQVGDSLDELNNSQEVMRLEMQHNFREEQIADSLKSERRRFADQLAYDQQLGEEREQRNIFLYSGIGVLLLAGSLWGRLRYTHRSRIAIQKEKDRSDALLHNILPKEVALELRMKGHAEAKYFNEVTILFSDFKGFTQMSEQLSPAELVEELNVYFKAFDAIMEEHGIEKIKTIGDAYMAAGGVPDARIGAAGDTVLAALKMQAFVVARWAERSARGRPAFRMRVGIHTGPVVAGIVGTKKFQYDIWGDTVNTASRMESSGEVGLVNLSEQTYSLIRNDDRFTFTPRGHVSAKGKGDLAMYFVAMA